MNTEELFFLGVLAAIVAGVTIIILGLRQRSQQLEMAHRERMAMIDRGLMPPPESVPAGAMPQTEMYTAIRSNASKAQMTFGIVMIGAGLAFMTVVGIAGQTPSVAIGLGGALVIFGAALIVISQVNRQPNPYVTATNIRIPRTPPVPPVPPEGTSSHDRI